MPEIHVGEQEAELKMKLEAAKAKFEQELADIAKDYAWCLRQRYRLGENEMTERAHRVLQGVFNPSFLTHIVFNLNTMPSKVITVNDLVAGRCNFPPELTQRTRSEKGGFFAPCRKKLGKDHVYFCNIANHRAYAKRLNLPVTLEDIKQRKLNLPEEIKDTRLDHVRKRSSTTEKWISEKKPVAAVAVELTRCLPSSLKKKKRRIEHVLDEIPRHQCVYVDPFNQEPCNATAVYRDDLTGDAAYCSKHVLVSEDLLQAIEESGDDSFDDLYRKLRKIQLLDAELVDGDIYDCVRGEKPVVLPLVSMETRRAKELAQERYVLASRCGLGTHPDVISLFASMDNPASMDSTASVSSDNAMCASVSGSVSGF